MSTLARRNRRRGASGSSAAARLVNGSDAGTTTCVGSPALSSRCYDGDGSSGSAGLPIARARRLAWRGRRSDDQRAKRDGRRGRPGERARRSQHGVDGRRAGSYERRGPLASSGSVVIRSANGGTAGASGMPSCSARARRRAGFDGRTDATGRAPRLLGGVASWPDRRHRDVCRAAAAQHGRGRSSARAQRTERGGVQRRRARRRRAGTCSCARRTRARRA